MVLVGRPQEGKSYMDNGHEVPNPAVMPEYHNQSNNDTKEGTKNLLEAFYEPGKSTQTESMPSLLQCNNLVQIPGQEESYETCGKIYKIHACTSCSYKIPVLYSCHRTTCSMCWRSWDHREAERVAERLNGYKEAYKVKRNKKLGSVKDFVFSPPQEWAVKLVSEPGGIQKLKQKLIEYMKANNLYGGNIIYHHERIKNEYKARLKDYQESSGDKRKWWNLIIEDVLELGSYKDYVYVSPHYHVKVYGAKTSAKQVKRFYNKSGWILKFKRHISTKEELEKVLFYELSHVAVIKGKRAVTWFGSLSYNKLAKHFVGISYEGLLCPKCGAELEEELLKTGDKYLAVKKIKQYEYRVRRPPPKFNAKATLIGWDLIDA